MEKIRIPYGTSEIIKCSLGIPDNDNYKILTKSDDNFEIDIIDSNSHEDKVILKLEVTPLREKKEMKLEVSSCELEGLEDDVKYLNNFDKVEYIVDTESTVKKV